MCIQAELEAARMRQHARDFKHEHQARIAAQDTRPNVHPIGPGWSMGLDGNGNAVVVPETRATRMPAGLSPALRVGLALAGLASSAIALGTLYLLAHHAGRIIDFLAALVPNI